ncbi:fatty acyl-CoA reductase wat-like isoform X2 [Leptopilina heterotoma]|uniref:fatty acyl-CoA reductase wat-like isoform X2 n=1 Tax=Leptopilina heterotoma TaxID=63436 RepID=UPI001CAA20EF|nr:fatty acyl-CoA reductase wat-like isoform X2 [Leptopilina heterotoma]
MSQIQEFYNDRSIFITGGTGFMGKILLEKLVRSLPKLKNIYLLIRPKKGKKIQERLDEFFKLEIFNPLREKNPFFGKKIIPLSGDVRKLGLGLSDEDRETLIKEVSIVIHAAATTKFDEPLKVAVPINVNSVLEIIKLCRELKKLKVAVYVSTAFIRDNSCAIEEKIYPLPMTHEEVNNTIEIINRRKLSKRDEEQFTRLLLGNCPNTYIFTKSIAEGILNEKARDLPFFVFRFPIASATYKEPVTGWVDTIQGFNQLMMGLGLGVIRTLLCPDKTEVMYMVPADFACNALIASIWDTENGRIRFYKIYKKGVKFFKSTEFFSMGTWTFENKRIELLWEKLSNEDKELFPFDMKNIVWSDVILEYWKGVLKYILKDDFTPENRRQAKRRYYFLLLLHRTIQTLFAAFLFWFLWKLF